MPALEKLHELTERFKRKLDAYRSGQYDAIPRRGNRLSRFIARSLMSMCGWRIEDDVPNLPKFVLIGAPHTSNWDFILAMITLSALNIKVSWMGKHTLFRWPFNGVLE